MTEKRESFPLLPWRKPSEIMFAHECGNRTCHCFSLRGKRVHCNEIGCAQSPQQTYSKSIERSSKCDSATQPSHINVPYTDNVPWKAGLQHQNLAPPWGRLSYFPPVGPSWILTRDVSRQRDGCFRDLSRSTSLRNMLNESDLKRPDKKKKTS